jgi:uncharacterized protein with PIN domain
MFDELRKEFKKESEKVGRSRLAETGPFELAAVVRCPHCRDRISSVNSQRIAQAAWAGNEAVLFSCPLCETILGISAYSGSLAPP